MFKFSKSKAMLMTAITAAPMMASTVTTVHAASINNNTVVKDTFKANSVATVRKAMQAQGLNVNDVNGKYIVRAGDTLSVIAEAAHMTVAQIAKENNISNVDMIYIGQVLFLNAGVDTNVNKGVANNPVVSDNIANTTIGTGAAAIMNSDNTYNYVGNGNSVALPSKTTSQMQASALANSGVNINNHANNTASAVNNGTTNKAVNTNNDTVNNTPVANHTNSANGNHVTTGTSHATSAVNNNHVNSAASTTSAAASTANHSQAAASNAASQATSVTSNANKPVSTASATTGTNKPASTVNNNSQATSAASTASQSQATSNANKPASTASQASQTASVAPSAAPSQATSAASQSSQASQSTTNYADGVVYPNGQINYQAAINQKGPWNNMTGDQAFQTWEQDHMSNGSVPYTAATGYADGSKSQIPMYGNGKGSITSPDINNKNSVNNPMDNQYRPIFNQQQCD